jgi:ABC-2 type transport system permease protein
MNTSAPRRARARQPLRLAYLFGRAGIQAELQYRVNFVVHLVQSLLSLGTGLAVLALIYQRTDELAGWSSDQLLVVMGLFTLMGGVIQTVIEPNMARTREEVRLGTFDHVLTKPADAQVLASVREFRLWSLVDVLLGAVVLAVALARLESSVGIEHAVRFVALLACGALLVYCFWIAVTTCVFWVVRMDEIQEMFVGLYRAGQFPVTAYPAWLRYTVTFLVPLGFAITVPAEALTDRLTNGTLLLSLGLTVGGLVLTRLFWRFGITRYAGASA